MPPSRNSKHNHHVAHVPDFILESFLGQAFYYALRSKVAFYPEEQPDFRVPERYVKGRTDDNTAQEKQSPAVVVPDSAEQAISPASSSLSAGQQHAEGRRDSDMTLVEQQSSRERRYNEAQEKHQRLRAAYADAGDGQTVDPESQLNAEEKELLGLKSDAEKQKVAQEEEDPNIVTWYGDDDPANPMKSVRPSKGATPSC